MYCHSLVCLKPPEHSETLQNARKSLWSIGLGYNARFMSRQVLHDSPLFECTSSPVQKRIAAKLKTEASRITQAYTGHKLDS